MNNFKNRVKARRKELGLTQKQLGDRVGLSFQWISHFETGNRKPAFEQLVRLSNALEISSDYLLGIDKFTP